MKHVRHRPCTICSIGHFKCNTKSVLRTCSRECSRIYAKNAAAFSGFGDRWYARLDLLPRRRAIVDRIGNKLVFKTEWEQQNIPDKKNLVLTIK